LAQTHHIACVSGDQLTFFDRSAGYYSKSLGFIDHPNSYWKGLVALCVGVEYLLVLMVQALEMLVVEGVNDEVFVKNVIDTILLLVKMSLDILQCSHFFIFIERVARMSE
jgi:hypothetical protein